MAGSRLDALAKDLATGRISRRSALRRFGAGFGAAVLPSFLFTDEALAKCPQSRQCGSHCCAQGARCKHGKCKCRDGKKVCGKHCVDTATDPSNCGTCGHSCPSGQTCTDGKCAAAICGNNVAEGVEQCDGTDLRGATCSSLGLGAGTLACRSNCTYDASSCSQPPVCGNGVIETGEQCDGSALGGATCASIGMGFTGGTLTCSPNCTYNTSACVSQTCGNNVIEGTEVCDGTALGGHTCADQGFLSGTLACGSNCLAFDTAGCDNCVANGGCPSGFACDGVCATSCTSVANCQSVGGSHVCEQTSVAKLCQDACPCASGYSCHNGARCAKNCAMDADCSTVGGHCQDVNGVKMCLA
jgi:hypothetical protein